MAAMTGENIVMETVVCHICGSGEASLYLEGEDFWYGSPGRFNLVRCGGCGLLYLNPRPAAADMATFYPDDYAPHRLGQETGGWWTRFRARYGLARQRRFVEKFAKPPGRVLDVGCATGLFLDEMRRGGWQAVGVEPDVAAAAFSRERLGVDVFTGDLEAAGFGPEDFDLVTFWHVLEHVYDPRATLQEARRICRPGGTLVVVIPNPMSWEAAWFGRTWAGWDFPRHLHLFDSKQIARLLKETGWRPVAATGNSGRLWLLRLSARHWLAQQNKPGVLARMLNRFVHSPLMWPLSLPYFWLAEKLNKSAVMAIVGRAM